MARYFSGARLRQARHESGLKLEQLALAVGRSASSVQSYEIGRAYPSIPVLIALVSVLGVPLEALFDTDDEQVPASV